MSRRFRASKGAVFSEVSTRMMDLRMNSNLDLYTVQIVPLAFSANILS